MRTNRGTCIKPVLNHNTVLEEYTVLCYNASVVHKACKTTIHSTAVGHYTVLLVFATAADPSIHTSAATANLTEEEATCTVCTLPLVPWQLG